MRSSLLADDPQTGPVTLPMLVGIANAIEQEAVRRYALLERTMRQRGEFETAEAFARMLEEERGHVELVARWAGELGVALPEAEPFEWILPRDLSESWEAIAGSALLTPYRAFAIAVENEQRAFAFYSYLAAHAGDRTVAEQAERLAAEELTHAARVRRWRREAYHRERAQPDPCADTSGEAADEAQRAAHAPEALRAFLDARHARIVACQRPLAARLRELGDEPAAALIEDFAAAHGASGDPGKACVADEHECTRIARFTRPLALLVEAQRPLEALGESLDRILSAATDETFRIAEEASTDLVGWLARIALAIEQRG